MSEKKRHPTFHSWYGLKSRTVLENQPVLKNNFMFFPDKPKNMFTFAVENYSNKRLI